jgi:hypothetical protein
MARKDQRVPIVRFLMGPMNPKGKIHAVLVRENYMPISACHMRLAPGYVWIVPKLKKSKVTCKDCRNALENLKQQLDSLVP